MAWRLFRRRRDAEIDEEIASHLNMAIRDRIDRGEPAAEARRHALVEFGSPAVAKEEMRAVWSWTALEQLGTDFRIGARVLWRAPALSATAIVLVALVIGGNTTIFSAVHGVLTKPAPGVSARGLVSIGWVNDRKEVHPGGSFPNYADLAAASAAVRPMLAFEFDRFILTTSDGSYAITGTLASDNYFDTLGIHLIKGHAFSDDRRAASSDASSGLVGVISERLWRDRFAASPDIVGASTILNGHAVTIVGVAPPDFHGVWLGETSDVWVPLETYIRADGREAHLNERTSPLVAAVGRLAEGVTMPEAQAEVSTIGQRLARDHPDTNRGMTVRLFPYSATAAGDSLVAQRGAWFLAMFSIVTALTLVLVCANVANLMLGRAVVRAREMAVRQSFGASRARIIRIFVAEGLVISIVAWAAAALLAYWITRALPQIVPPLDGNGAQIAFDFTPDWTVIGYAMALALAATALFSAAPAIRVTRHDLQPFLKVGEQGVVQGRSTMSSALVVLQLALSVLLLTTAGLAYRSLSMLSASDLGIDRNQLLLVTINTKAAAANKDANVTLVDRMLERVRAVPQIAAASFARRPIQSFWPPEHVTMPGRGRPVAAERNEVGPGYLRALGVAPLVGRDFEAAEPDRGTFAAVVNQRFADTLWPGEPAIGRTLTIPSYHKPIAIVGVVPNAFYNGFRRDPDPNFLLVSAQQAAPPPGEMTLLIRYTGSLDRIVPAIGSALNAVSDRAPMVYVRTIESQLAGLTWPVHALTILLTLFAAVSLLIATVGQYAAMSFTMRRRTRDFGVRMALGASTREIRLSVLREGSRLTAVGLAIGMALSLAVAQALRSFLFGVAPTDARTFAGVLTLLAAASLVACYLPAHRASRIDPMAALRQE